MSSQYPPQQYPQDHPTHRFPPAGPPPAYGYPGGAGPAPLPPGWAYASFGRRLVAYLIDVVSLFGCLLPAGVLGPLAMYVLTPEGDEPAGAAVLLLVVLAVGGLAAWLWQFTWRQGTTGQSWGKQAMGLRTVHADTLRPVGGGLGVLRYLVFNVLGNVTFCLEVLWALWDARHQTLHDKIITTVVLRTR